MYVRENKRKRKAQAETYLGWILYSQDTHQKELLAKIEKKHRSKVKNEVEQ